MNIKEYIPIYKSEEFEDYLHIYDSSIDKNSKGNKSNKKIKITVSLKNRYNL